MTVIQLYSAARKLKWAADVLQTEIELLNKEIAVVEQERDNALLRIEELERG